MCVTIAFDHSRDFRFHFSQEVLHPLYERTAISPHSTVFGLLFHIYVQDVFGKSVRFSEFGGVRLRRDELVELAHLARALLHAEPLYMHHDHCMPEKVNYVGDMGRRYDDDARFDTHLSLPCREDRRCQDGIFRFGLNLVLPKLGYKRFMPHLLIL